MPQPGQLPGRYNIVIADEYDLFDHRVPVDEYLNMLREDNVPDELCVVGLGDAFEDSELIDELSRTMDRRADDLESRNPLPTIQFAVDGSFQRRKHDFELEADGDLHRLSQLFGSQIERQDSGWLIMPF